MTASALRRRRRRAVWSVLGTVAVAAVALLVGMVAGPAVRSPAQAVAEAAPPAPAPVTAAAERRVLTEPVITRGTVQPGSATKVTAPEGLSGVTAVVTRMSARVGTPLHEGTVFTEVAGEPVFGLVLPFPLYRDLTPGIRGPDVTEVQKALRRLGAACPVTGTFDAGTSQAVDRFYRARGYDVPRGGAATQPPENQAAAAPPEPILRRVDVVRLDRDGRTITAVPAQVGTVLNGAASVLLELDAGAATVQAKVDPAQRALVRPGSTAKVTDEAQGTTVEAVVRTVADQADADGYAVTLAFTGPVLPPGPDHTVLVILDPAADATPVLAVPVSAVYSRPDGSTFVTVVGRDRARTDVVVRTGKVAGGWVEVAPDSNAFGPGAQVVVGASAAGGK
ncbi:peptidoglycan-binding protein [Amycolatopsis sp. NPDC049691]|uniref:peptidoglycan-binding protein n=1 Tax=Amycolatopsis sp. NPDC049691 TaxID=3155155 RepID=UPI00343EA930